MPDAALNAYLAKNYLEGAKAEALLARNGTGHEERRKRKKKKVHDEGETSARGLRFVDENDSNNWRKDGDSEEEAVVIIDETDQGNRKRSKWSKLGGNEEEEEEGGGGGVVVVEEEEKDEKPQMAGEDGLGLDDSMQTAVRRELEEQQNGQGEDKKPAIRAGLKTKEEMRVERLAREKIAAAREAASQGSNHDDRDIERRRKEREERAQETIYRDASGRKIDTRKDDEEKRLAREEEKKRERERKDWNKGQVQLDRARDAKKREEEERNTSFARYSNDERMNKELRNIQRAADPALGFLTKKQTSKGPQKPSYKGSFPPNRFHIRPGYRWDGVERSNGFEAKYFQKKHQRAHRRDEMDAWGKEDM